MDKFFTQKEFDKLFIILAVNTFFTQKKNKVNSLQSLLRINNLLKNN